MGRGSGFAACECKYSVGGDGNERVVGLFYVCKVFRCAISLKKVVKIV